MCDLIFDYIYIQVGIRPDRRARGMLHISGGGSEWGVAESGRGGSNVPPPWGNAGRGNVPKWRYFGAGGLPEAPWEHPWRHSWRGVLIFDDFGKHFGEHWETIWHPWGPQGTPLSPFFSPGGAILQPRGGIRGNTRKRPAFLWLRGMKKGGFRRVPVVSIYSK